MSRAPARFTEADITRALNAANKIREKTGQTYKIEVGPDNVISIVPFKAEKPLKKPAKPAPSLI